MNAEQGGVKLTQTSKHSTPGPIVPDKSPRSCSHLLLKCIRSITKHDFELHSTTTTRPSNRNERI